MATKHLYCTEDVAGTLIYALQNSDKQLACSCAQELNQSGEADYLLKVLTFVWLMHEPGFGHYESLGQRNPMVFLMSLLDRPLILPKFDERPVLPLPLPLLEEPDCQWAPKSLMKHQAYRLWKAVNYSIKQKHWDRAYRLTRPLLKEGEAAVSLLKALGSEYMAYLLETTVFLPLAERVLMHAFYLLTSEAKQVKPKYTKNIFEKERRTFRISPEALKMWHIKPKPITDLIGSPVLIRRDDASQYWKDMSAKFQITGKKLKFTNDELLEQFYTECFPNDIPDEWSNEEREKSHGFSESLEEIENPWFPAFIMLN